MAVSNSVDFNLTASQIIEEARALLGIHADEEPMEAHELQRGLRVLNMMLKEWQADPEISISHFTEGQLTLVASQESYAFGSGGDFTTVPFEIKQVRITRGGNDIEMHELGRQEYFRLPNKTNTGYPTTWYYDRQRSGGTLYVWPAPDATAGTLKFTYLRIINDMDANADDLDLPQEWIGPTVDNLAERLIPYYGKSASPRAQDIRVRAMRGYNLLKGFNNATGKSVLEIIPDWS